MSAPTRSDVEAFREALAKKIGLRFEDDRVPHLEELLASRLANRTHGMPEYLASLGSEEVSQLMRSLSVSETYFLRNAPHFRAIEERLRARRGRPIRILSAGCSSGEEAYSLAIVARETLLESELALVSILGVDLNPDSIARAREGRYGDWSLRETPPAVIERWFQRQGGRFAVVDSIQKMVRFEQVNLVQPPPLLFSPETWDVVLCRNVIMYLTPAAQSEVVASVARALVPGGLLFLGHAETLRGISQDFHLLHQHDTFFYARRAGGPEPVRYESAPVPLPDLGDVAWYEAIARSSHRIEELSRPKPELRTRAPAKKGDPDALLLHAVSLATTGDAAGAERASLELLQIDELNAGAHFVMALCRETAGDVDGAREHDRVAAYLDPEFAMPHLHGGILARRANDLTAARRELELALALLAREDAARIVLFGGGFGRDGLMQLCRHELSVCGGAQ